MVDHLFCLLDGFVFTSILSYALVESSSFDANSWYGKVVMIYLRSCLHFLSYLSICKNDNCYHRGSYDSAIEDSMAWSMILTATGIGFLKLFQTNHILSFFLLVNCSTSFANKLDICFHIIHSMMKIPIVLVMMNVSSPHIKSSDKKVVELTHFSCLRISC